MHARHISQLGGKNSVNYSFLDFWANLFNIGGTIPAYKPQNPALTDAKNLRKDFEMVGKDMRKSMDKEKEENLSKTTK